jgi:hypothetical protein
MREQWSLGPIYTKRTKAARAGKVQICFGRSFAESGIGMHGNVLS